MSIFNRYLGYKRDGNWWTGSRMCERKHIVEDGTQVSVLDTGMDDRYKHRDEAFGRRK